mmetsp:Transcript_62051/g.134634  ORF Transcript_62051/g.134634 Transcript_62051/m.134634 type:complete len:268 (-) Transcript_62051:317-1120(-)|eukprot:CAMPEP_0170582262 /NCGR_PEP_ID=MMETSP0224-20130122/7488_1 /TAXON_ID=285029 /ORGANISM="Togula jolla, Strain CCCM 725" /LENGTH=267 /DNA_ID=CAMNT_0010905471 /DNA_START=135 /DNA_END=938 /DNA_ORIENTATION=-
MHITLAHCWRTWTVLGAMASCVRVRSDRHGRDGRERLLRKPSDSESGPIIGTLVLLHGMNGTGQRLRNEIFQLTHGGFEDALEDAGISVIYPTASEQAMVMQVGRCWGGVCREENPHLAAAEDPLDLYDLNYRLVLQPLLQELDETMGLEHVVVAGYSVGGNMVAQLLRLGPKNLAGLAVMKGTVHRDPELWAAIGSQAPRLFLMTGSEDHVTLASDVQGIAKEMREVGMQVTVAENQVNHFLHETEVMDLADWAILTLNSQDFSQG